MRFISRHLLAPDLNVATIARACAVSRATLYRAFDNHGGVAAQIQRMRLDRAREALRSRFNGVPTITGIAFDYGFSSQGHFSRAYRARFGYSPSDEPSLWGGQRAGCDSRSAKFSMTGWRTGCEAAFDLIFSERKPKLPAGSGAYTIPR